MPIWMEASNCQLQKGAKGQIWQPQNIYPDVQDFRENERHQRWKTLDDVLKYFTSLLKGTKLQTS